MKTKRFRRIFDRRSVRSSICLKGIRNFKNVTVAASKRAEGAKRGHLNSAPSSTISSQQGSIDGNSMQRCGLCSMFSRFVRRAMCVGSRRGSGESYYQELADTTVSISSIDSYIKSYVSFDRRLSVNSVSFIVVTPHFSHCFRTDKCVPQKETHKNMSSVNKLKKKKKKGNK